MNARRATVGKRQRVLAVTLTVAGAALVGGTLVAISHDDDAAATPGRPSTTSTGKEPLLRSAPPSPTSPTSLGSPTQAGTEPEGPGRGAGSRPEAPRVRPGWASELQLPSIGVVAPVTPIGQDGSLTLVPPDDISTVGWWATGPRPGSRHGTAIMTGHSLSTGGAALNELEDVAVGDPLILSRPRGDLVYDVTSVTMYRKGTVAEQAGAIFDQSVPGRLAVVTCEEWNGYAHLSNLVVIAENPRPVPDQG